MVMTTRRSGFLLRLGDYLGSNPWDLFLETLKHSPWVRRVFFGAILITAFYTGATRATIGFFAGLWAFYEAIYYIARFVRSKF